MLTSKSSDALNGHLIAFALLVGSFSFLLLAFAVGSARGADEPSQETPAPHVVRVGDVKLTVLYDAIVGYERESLFTNAPADELTVVDIPGEGAGGKIFTPYEAVLVETPTNIVLIDTGAGPSKNPARGRLMESLAKSGVEPGRIDTVILTHGHLDHIGGTTLADGTLAFPNARYVMARAEWEFWDAEHPDLSTLPFDTTRWVELAHNKLRPLRERMRLVDADTEVCPGVSVLLAAGHTPGHMLVRVDSAGRGLLYVSDLILSPVAIEHPDWRTKFELDVDASQATKQRILALAADERLLVHAMHFPYPGLGHIVRIGDHFAWQSDLLPAGPAQLQAFRDT